MPRGVLVRPLRTTGLLLGALLLAACSSDDVAETGATPATPGAAPAAPAPPPTPPTWPMTGLPVEGGGDGAQRHPVIVLKMDNTSSSAPQQGLGQADLVVEELVEGGLTRLAAFFYSEIPGEVGPVRSMRASDIGIVKPVDASVVTSGAASVTIDRISRAGIEYFNEGARGFFRESSRTAPYNLFTDLSETATLTRGPQARPADYLPWGTAEALPEGRTARGLVARFGSGHATEWSYDKGRYTNVNSYAAEGDEFPTDTVLVMRVEVGDAGYRDPAGYPVPETKLEGKGNAFLFHDGKVVTGTWEKDGLEDTISLKTSDGKLTVPAGHTWVELVPQTGGTLTYN